MQCLKDCKFEFNKNTLYNVRKDYNLHNPGDMEKAVNIFEEWVKQQKHFKKKDFPREVLERLIIIGKGSIERAKQKLDKTCTFRTLMPEYFMNYDIENDFKELDGIIYQAGLPKMTEDDCRVYMFRNVGKKFEPTILHTFYRTLVLFAEYTRTHDYAKSYIMIIDYRETNLMELASKIYPGELRKGIALFTEGYGFRLKALHILSDSKLVELVVKIFKQVMSQKLGDRIQVHKSLEDLYKFVPKDILPMEYGGKEKPLIELHDSWFKMFGSKEYKEYFKEMSEAKVDETLRPTDQFNEQYMGMPGTFRNITVD